MATNNFWAIFFIVSSISVKVGAQPVDNIPPQSVSVNTHQIQVVITTAVSDSIRKKPARFGPPADWVRGQHQILYVIDGKLEDEVKLKQLDPQNIESMEVVKGDQAAAIYGTRGVDGVIIIITKKSNKKRGRLK